MGTQLAKREIRAVLREFFAQVGDAAVDGEPEYLDSIVVNGLAALPLRLTPAKTAPATGPGTGTGIDRERAR